MADQSQSKKEEKKPGYLGDVGYEGEPEFIDAIHNLGKKEHGDKPIFQQIKESIKKLSREPAPDYDPYETPISKEFIDHMSHGIKEGKKLSDAISFLGDPRKGIGPDGVKLTSGPNDPPAPIQEPPPEDFKFELGEDAYLVELRDYIQSTYSQHYAADGEQTIISIIEKGEGIGFTKGNIRKLIDRYRKKGSKDDWRKDLLKVAHFAILLLKAHDYEETKNNETH
ncbi:MAG TPA: hypothetical protein VIJ93_06895 [bacterium]